MYKKKDFKRELYEVSPEPKFDIEYAWEVYKENIAPYTQLIGYYRGLGGDEKLNLEKIRKVLDITTPIWNTFKKMPTFKEYLNVDKDLMSMKAMKDIVKGVSLSPDNAAMLKLQAERFDPHYEDKEEDRQINVNIGFVHEDAEISEEEIKEKIGFDPDKLE